jgi:hypothetical protein
LFWSLTVTVYVFAPKAVDELPEPEGVQLYVYVPVPPPALSDAVPSVYPKQLTLVWLVTASPTCVGWVMETVEDAVQELASVTVTV